MGLSLRQITAVTQPILKVSTHKFLDFPWVCTLGTYHTTTKKHGKSKTHQAKRFLVGVYGVIFGQASCYAMTCGSAHIILPASQGSARVPVYPMEHLHFQTHLLAGTRTNQWPPPVTKKMGQDGSLAIGAHKYLQTNTEKDWKGTSHLWARETYSPFDFPIKAQLWSQSKWQAQWAPSSHGSQQIQQIQWYSSGTPRDRRLPRWHHHPIVTVAMVQVTQIHWINSL